MREASANTSCVYIRPSQACVLTVALAAFTVSPARGAQTPDSELPQDANQLARTVLENEVLQQDRDHALWTYRLVRQENGAVKTYRACQTDEGEIRRLIAINGEPLTPAGQEAEDRRVEALAHHPDHIREAQRKQQEDAAKARKLMNILPDAFVFRYEDSKPDPANPLVRLRFRPNPVFHPSGEAEVVFHHMEGEMIVDVKQKRLKELRGKLTSEVKFFGGIFGHLDRGGTFFVTQEDLGDGRWEMAELNVQMDGKALFFKTIAVRQKEAYSDYQLLPPHTQPAQAIAMLFNSPSPAALVSR
jgi:hypothetical protein